jgi:tetratricopeptide (TPR) repeat protein
MGLFRKLFGKKSELSRREFTPPPSTAANPQDDPNLIRVFDKYGHELFITKEDWRKDVLPDSIKSAWNNPDQLYVIILNALEDGFRTDIVDAARQLYEIDSPPVRGTCIWGIVLTEEGRLDEAEKVFKDYIAKYGEDGVILTNLAKVWSRRKNDVQAEKILWHALEVDPNQDNGLDWYSAIQHEQRGEAAWLEAMQRISALPRSWRAQLRLAHAALQSRNLNRALELYRESLSRAGQPVPRDLLMQMSGDLGKAGHLPELLELAEPHFDVKSHGLQVGNNLIKAHLDLGQLEAARKILDQLYTLNRPDWNENLRFWDTEIAKARLGTTIVDEESKLKVVMLAGEGPVWLKPSSPASELFHAKEADAPAIAFLGSTAELATDSKNIQPQMSDTPGRMSRALPLFLAEQIELNSKARTQTLVPWVAGESVGFVLGGVAWSDEIAANSSLQCKIKNDYVVTIHLKTQVEPWIVELRLIRVIDGKCLKTLSDSFLSVQPHTRIPELAKELLLILGRQAEVKPQTPSPLYQLPSAVNFSNYLLRLEQLLAVRCAGTDGANPGFLNNEREIIEGNLQLCLACPDNVNTRILLAQTVLAMKHVRPDILPEFKNKFALLQQEHPLQRPAHDVVQRMFNEV